MLERSHLFDPELVARIGGRVVAGPPSPYPHRGIHRSSRRGASLEFSEHTEYSAGDDLRQLDWKVFAKTDRFFIKRYEDERVQRTVFLVDASASMSYGGAEGGLVGSKFHLAARIAVALATHLLRQGDAVGLRVATGDGHRSLRPRGGSAQLEAFIELLADTRPSGVLDLEGALRTLGDQLRRSASVFVVSDLLDEGAETLPGCAALRARGIEPRVIHLLHAEEVEFPYEHTARFEDLEGPATLVLDPLPLRKAYREEIAGFVRRVAAAAEGLGVPHAFCHGGSDPARPLARMIRHLGRG